MMKKFAMLVSAVFVLLLAIPVTAQAQEGRPAGVGIGLGQGTLVSGISLKHHMGANAIQGVIGCTRQWAGRCHGAGVSGDFLFNMPIFFEADPIALGWNIGGGAAVGVGWERYRHRSYRHDRYYGAGTVHVAGQFVAGLEIIFPTIPIDIVLEWRPHLRVAPFFDLWPFGGGAHIRFYLG